MDGNNDVIQFIQDYIIPQDICIEKIIFFKKFKHLYPNSTLDEEDFIVIFKAELKKKKLHLSVKDRFLKINIKKVKIIDEKKRKNTIIQEPNFTKDRKLDIDLILKTQLDKTL
jgi:hypothetical protein